MALQANRATLQGRQGQIEIDLATARLKLAKALLRLEAPAPLEAAMQAHIHRHADELDVTRQSAWELSGKPATKLPKAPSKE